MKRIGKCLTIGLLAGVLNGLFGAGGGLILVPLLISWLHIEEKSAFATSIAIILPLSIISYCIFCIRGGSIWSDALPYAIGGVIGGILSARLFHHIPARWLHRIFALFLLYGGIKAVIQW